MVDSSLNSFRVGKLFTSGNTAKKFLVFISVYVLLQFIARILLTDSLEIDEAEQVYLSQKILWGYNQQPPLYTWITALFIKLFGYSVASIIAFRFIIIWVTYIFYYKTAQLLIKSETLQILATLSLILFIQFSFEGLRHTHTMLVTLATVWMLYMFLCIYRNSSTWNYIALGLIFALGLLAKYNFALGIAGALLALISIPEYRAKVLTPKILISFLVCFLLFLPHFLWLLSNLSQVTEETLTDFGTAEKPELLLGILQSFWGLLKGILSFGGIFYLFMFIIFRRKSIAFFKKSNPLSIFIGRYILITLSGVLIILLITQGHNAHERWLQPFILPLPLYLFAIVDQYQLKFNSKLIEKLMVAIYAILLLAKSFSYTSLGSMGIINRINRPYPELATYLLEEEKFNEVNLIVCDEIALAGNIKFLLPEETVIYLPKNCKKGKEIIPLASKILSISINPEANPLNTCTTLTTSFLERIEKNYYYDQSKIPYTVYLKTYSVK